MDQLIAKLKPFHGRKASRNCRRSGDIPAIIYGDGKNPISITLKHNDIFYLLQNENFHTSVLRINIGGVEEKVVLRQYQMHPFMAKVVHVDFLRVNDNKPVQIVIPIHFKNENVSYAVKMQNAHITVITNNVIIQALPKDIPHFIEVDLKDLRAGQVIHVSDLVTPQGVSLASKHDLVVVSAAGIDDEDLTASGAVNVADIPSSKKTT